ncbi:MAG: recombinase family protein [Nanoarchaeota archaeon]
MFKVAKYIRVSSREQALEGWSVDAQNSKLDAYIKIKEWEVYDTYLDAGKTAGDLSKPRPDFERLVKDALQKKFDGVLFVKMDRGFRNTKHALDILERFVKVNVQFVSLNENIDTTTATGRFFFTMIIALAELERGWGKERLQDVLEEKFNRGILIGKMPFGYKWNKKEKKPFIDENKSQIVRNIFNDTLNGKSYKEICRTYKIPVKSYYNIIKNKTYAGYVIFNNQEQKGIHQKIITEEIFNQVQELLKSRRNKK